MQDKLHEYNKENDKRVMSSKTFARIAKKFDLPNKRVLDIGCATGSFMQRFGQNSVGITTDKNEVEFGKEFGRDIRFANAELLTDHLDTSEVFDVIWCNNIFEHILSPHAFLVKLKEFSGPNTIIILGTPMVPSPTILMRSRKFRGALASPHINFFNYKTYELTVNFSGWETVELNPFFFALDFLNTLTRPLSPHLYIVAKNNSEYQYPLKKIKEWQDDAHYKTLLDIMG
tara:strand:+ start:6702 stop:7391 length:690 start_codon:yes stop_codon:yes gene_type:complete